MLEYREESLGAHFQKHHIHLGDDVFVVLHRFTLPDEGDPHSHPWAFQSMVTKGSYVEEIFDMATGASERILRKRGDHFDVPANRIHRIVELPEGECCTAVLYGPREQDFGHYRWVDGRPQFKPIGQDEFRPV